MSMAISVLSKMAMSLLSERLIKTLVLIGLKKVLEYSEKDEDNELSESNQKLYDEVARAWGMH